MAKSQFFIIDAHGMIYRAIHRPGKKLRAPSGEPVRGVYTFTNMLLKLVSVRKPDYLVLATDAPRATTFRRRLYDKYKSNRPEGTDKTLFKQVDRCREVAEALGIKTLMVPGFEADDVIASFVDTCASDEVECVVVSSDKDLNQLIGPNCRQYDDMKSLWLDAQVAAKKWGVPPDKIVEVMMLMGDATDGVPGVHGIGEIAAKKAIQRFGTVDALVEAVRRGAAPLNKRQRENLLAADLKLCRQLVELRRDVPLDVHPSELEFNGPDMAQAEPLFRELGFWSLLEKVA